MTTIRDEDIDHLVSMGFPYVEVRSALQITSGNLEMAVNHLISGGNESGAAFPTMSLSNIRGGGGRSNDSISSVVHFVQGTTSQYTYSPDGRSACTCIALTAADMILNNTSNERIAITTVLLDQAIAEGVTRYQSTRQRLFSSPSSGSEHLSAEEVLVEDNSLFEVRVNVQGGIRQGVLSRNINHPLGMTSCLEGLVRDIREQYRQLDRNNNYAIPSNSDQVICIILTKTPETILLCIPTDDNDITTSNDSMTKNQQHQKYYWLVDSHPRPQLLPGGVETCYAKSHLTMDSLLQSLRDLFPFTYLGSDVPHMMSDMYNMYDLYPLERRRR
mmetsp:Transcript_50136/g.56001  ORF Transcript_50136/g.56001 Transcript_50136/m.56001 type:complete len:330 (-) Transcript_50136:394-1383(-)|eukprot:CAMPEP_0170783098 /NCGR_PEP_ID=MMETSP0733-20121128/15305_1 /TAXON_ID=186038 /ORGANISM="Fragilariopsis kerguelensis, Strain L26-C5" /LENGTH=329 /DNA_ID=CAMNT_0011127689 /DNA_START=26 /DNA_END=1015 /DNA_ORIENTATION=+